VRSSSAPWHDPTHASLRRAVERLYRKGRKAYERANEEPCEEALHESRKQTKYLGNALEVVDAARHGALARRVKRADRIADALGEDHDLALLQKKLKVRRRSNSASQALLTRIERRRERLQRKAAKQSRRLYGKKAKAFVAALDRDAAR
jgi:CHAD domain-containing protein